MIGKMSLCLSGWG